MSGNDTSVWVSRVLADLRAFAADLLEAGIAPSARAVASGDPASPLSATLDGVDLVCRRLPDLLAEIDGDDSFQLPEMVSSPTPRQAFRTLRPADYALHGDRLLPRRWLRPEVAPELRIEPLRWLIHFIDSLQQQLGRYHARLEKAGFAREGQTAYAQEEMKRLTSIGKSVENARHRLDQCLATLYQRAGRTVTGNPRLPHPFPRSAAWQGLRGEIRHRSQAIAQQAAEWLQDADDASLTTAELPYLYQRWCGLQIVRAAARLGWHTDDDAAGALLLGGVIGLGNGTSRLELWIEPRLAAQQAERIGWRSSALGEELTPDFLFVCGPTGARDAFVLDATLSRGKDQRDDRAQVARDKGRYRELLAGMDPVSIAGVLAVRKPLRAWAMAPIRSRSCILGEDREGRTGIIPMDAHTDDFSGLDAWLGDVFAHAGRQVAWDL